MAQQSSRNQKQAQARQELATYNWKGRDRQGRTQTGALEAYSQQAAESAIRKKGLTPVRVKKQPKALFGGNKIPTHDTVVMTRQLATMIDAGLPLVDAFKLIANGFDNAAMRKTLHYVAEDLESGQPLREALGDQPHVFGELYVNMVHAGEKGGILDTVLNRLATYLEKTEALRGKIKSAMFYPVAVIVVAFLVTAVLMMFVIPQFQEIFAGFGQGLPGPTVFVINLSEGFRANWYWIFGSIIAVFFGFRAAYRRSERFHREVDRYLLRLPVFGPLLRKAAIARLSRTFATLMTAGVPMLDTLDTVARTAGNRIVQEAIQETQEAVEAGQRLSDPLEMTGVFPAMVTQMIAIGEEAGSLETMLSKIADFYEQEVDTAVDGLTDLLEPIIMVILGVVLGGLVIAMYLPIFQMGDVIG